MYTPEMFKERFSTTWRYIYVIVRIDLRTGEMQSKVGISDDPDRRAIDLHYALGGSRNRVVIVAATFNTPHAEAVELAAHEALKDHLIEREWFDVAPEKAIAVVQDEVAKMCKDFVENTKALGWTVA